MDGIVGVAIPLCHGKAWRGARRRDRPHRKLVSWHLLRGGLLGPRDAPRADAWKPKGLVWAALLTGARQSSLSPMSRKRGLDIVRGMAIMVGTGRTGRSQTRRDPMTTLRPQIAIISSIIS